MFAAGTGKSADKQAQRSETRSPKVFHNIHQLLRTHHHFMQALHYFVVCFDFRKTSATWERQSRKSPSDRLMMFLYAPPDLLRPHP